MKKNRSEYLARLEKMRNKYTNPKVYKAVAEISGVIVPDEITLGEVNGLVLMFNFYGHLVYAHIDKEGRIVWRK